MKQYRGFLLGMLVTVLAATLFWAGTAYAATGCFPDTNGYWAESFICWLKDHGITAGYGDGTFKPNNSITRGELAVMLQRASNVPPSTGEIRINLGPNDWVVRYPSALAPVAVHPDGYIQWFSSDSSNNTNTALMTPDFPSALYGRNLSLTGMEYCYRASPPAYIDLINVSSFSETSSGAYSSSSTLVLDDTNRTDEACHYYSITPTALDDNTVLSIYVNIHWGPSSAGTYVGLARVTLFLQPTDNPVVAP